VAVERDDAEERKARIDVILEELRLNTEDMRELAKQAAERARQTMAEVQSTVAKARGIRAGKKR
jgi:hypothetical protein